MTDLIRAELQTARLVLRPLAADDEAALVAALNDAAVARWLSRVPHPYGPADFASFLPKATPGQVWAILDAEGFAGVIALEADMEFGYWLAKRAWGQGLATEAARAVLSAHFADAKAADVVAGYFVGNARSAHVLNKLGFAETGRGETTSLAREGAVPHVRLALSRADYLTALPLAAHSARLDFRPLDPADLPELHDLVSQWEVVRQLGSFPWPPERAFTATRAKPYGGKGFYWGMFRESRLIGSIGVTDGVLGYMLQPTFWRQGYASEALRITLTHAFADPDLTRITASVWEDNAASASLLAKFGFHETHRSLEPSKARGGTLGSRHFALNRAESEFRPRPRPPRPQAARAKAAPAYEFSMNA
jgi:RimJ/RimL family protein N-acetyltransferase